MVNKTKSMEQKVSKRISRPFKEFVTTEQLSGMILILCTAIALILTNFILFEDYNNFWSTKMIVKIGEVGLDKSVLLWINDGLMAIFFFVIGLEIKREILTGELNSLRKASLPIIAAMGGIVIPALIYIVFNLNSPESISGWGIPMATDIAFTLGILALMGKRAPFPLKVFITGLAIIDDIVAVLVIAVFYSSNIDWIVLFAALFIFLTLVLLNRLNIQNPNIYIIFGVILWFFILQSGIHATIAGVLLAFTIPAQNKVDANRFIVETQLLIEEFETSGKCESEVVLNQRQQSAIKALETACQNVEPPLQRYERLLHYWVAFAIIPIFILANSGVLLGDIPPTIHAIELGIFFGLVLGKPLGISLATWIAVKSGITSLPSGLTWVHILGASFLAGIGFTMALFISNLAITDPVLLIMTKFSILVASLIAAILGVVILARTTPIELDLEEFEC
ncbi:MAG: Na+/H+ antiporter NhaA [Candidatus Hodarchaeales archaeon]|jgi:NhaA family Na+:H+ antiporter